MLTLLVAAIVVAAPLAVHAQPATRLHRIGILEIEGQASNAPYLEAFRHRLKELGYVEGQNLVLEYRSAGGRNERFLDLATELVRLDVDVIVTRGEPAAIAAKHATRTIPIVMATSGDPVVTGIVSSLTRRRGNVTGFHIMAPPEIGGRRLQLLREAVPSASRIGILWNPIGVDLPLIVQHTERAAGTLGVRLERFEVQNHEALEKTFEAALMGQIDALIAVEDAVVVTDRARIVEFAAMSRLPAIYGLREFVDAGGLMSYGTDRRDLFRRCAAYVDRILKGANPADLPVQPPEKFELAINLKTARALGVTIPPSLLERADYVVR